MKNTQNENTQKHTRLLMIFFLTLILSITVFGGCRKQDDTNNMQSQTTNTTASDNGTDAPVPQTKEIPTDSEGDETPAPPETTDILLYGIQNETLETEQVKVSIPNDTKITSDFIVQQVVSLFEENSIELGIDSVTAKGDTVIVSFQSDKAPLVNVGSGVETTILDSIAMSLLDNIDECKKVIFQVEGKAYMSGHIELGIDEVYKWK